MDTEKTLRVLYSQNPWWVARRPEETINVPLARRDVYTELEKSFKFERITALAGMRRVGKTTLLMQLIRELIQRVNPLQVLYLSADSVEFQSVEFPIKEAFTVYLEKIAPKDARIYFFVDEAHFSSNWAIELKNIWDRHKPKVFVTGSAALTLLKKSKESLAGRVVTYNLPPLGLAEFARLRSSLDINAFLEDSLLGEARDEVIERFLENPVLFERLKKDVYQEFVLYLRKGGFPESIRIEDEASAFRFIREDIIDRVIYADIPNLFSAVDVALLSNLFLHSIYMSGELFSYNSLSAAYSVKRDTVSNYITYLSSSGLIIVFEKFARGYEGMKKANKKMYPSDISLRNAILGTPIPPQGTPLTEAERQSLGKAIELLAGTRLHYQATNAGGSVFYWRQVEEVDFVLREKETLLPIEIKYRTNVSKKDITGLSAFMERYKTKKGIVVTNDIFKKDVDGSKTVYYIPAWFFLLEV